jgi:5-methylcytosine-specific restriction enzyme subunit McrC
VPLTPGTRDLLREAFPDLDVTPAKGQADKYDLTPGSTVGVLEVGDLVIEVQPKLEFGHLMFVLSYALAPTFWQATRSVPFADATSLVEAIVPTFVHHLRRALAAGVLQGYREIEESAMFVRGRIRFGDQLKLGRAVPLPIEISYDDFTEDILENRLLKAAIKRLSRMTLRSERSRLALREFDTALDLVRSVDFDSGHVPTVHYTRVNWRYRHAVEMARLVLRRSSVELGPGRQNAVSFVINMNDAFENFVVVGLREALHLPPSVFPQQLSGRALHLDRAGDIRLEPDLSWWESGRCVFVGDAKYKRLSVAGFKHPDIYQMLAYLTALGLNAGLLVYGAGVGAEPSHEIVDGKHITVVALDLAKPSVEVLTQIERLALLIREKRQVALARAA